MYLTYWGKQGLPVLGKEIIGRAAYLAERISDIDGAELKFPGVPFFNEIVVRLNREPPWVNEELFCEGFIGGFPLENWFDELDDCLLLSVTERTGIEDIDAFCEELEGSLTGTTPGGDLK